MKAYSMILASVLSIGALTAAYADEAQNVNAAVQQQDPTGSNPATNLPYQATQGRLPFAQGEAQ